MTISTILVVRKSGHFMMVERGVLLKTAVKQPQWV